MQVALITVGDEILSGDTVNTNAAWLSERLTQSGAVVSRISVVPDDVSEIARVVNEYRAAYDAVIVTGGLGPTHDDKTMAAVAAAFGTKLATDPAVERWLVRERGYSAKELAPSTTQIPERAEMLRNPEGVAPGCTIGNVYVLPGVPTEMQAMFGRAGAPARKRIDRTETVRDEFDVSVGSYPGKNVTLRIHSTNKATVKAAADWLRARVEPPVEPDA
jgi:molybdenum cofactor synthesis domain-containing protein